MPKYSGISFTFSLILYVFFVYRHVKVLKLLQEVSNMLSHTFSSLTLCFCNVLCQSENWKNSDLILTDNVLEPFSFKGRTINHIYLVVTLQ